MRVKQMRLIDLPDEAIDAHAALLAPFCVALARVVAPEAKLIGSGTLVEHRKAHGILTARHVAEQLQVYPEVDIVLQRTHRFSIETKHLDVVCSAKGATEEAGPDIAFIRLPDANLGTIKAVRSFVNLDTHRSRIEANARNSGLWCVFGFPEEKASVRRTPDNNTLNMFGQCGVGAAPDRYQVEGEFDYFWARAVYSETNDLPASYGGVSGGGLWQTQVLEDHGTFRITEPVLRGVAFYQTARSGDSRCIKCHGDKRIYSWLVAEIDRRSP